MLGCDDEDDVYILRTPKNKTASKPVTILLIKDKDGNKHYCFVKSLSRLLSSQVSKKKCKRLLLLHFKWFQHRDIPHESYGVLFNS